MTHCLHRSTPLKLLVSVRNAEEATAALAGGADWIDLKEPSRGALGAVDAAVAQEVVACVAGRAPVSAAAGELRDWTNNRSRVLLDVDGVSVLKLGLAGLRDRPWTKLWHAARREIEAVGKEVAAVIYVDDAIASAPDSSEILEAANASSSRWVLMDTYDKQSGTLASCFNKRELRSLFASARSESRIVVAAGRVELDALSTLPLESVDMVAVRGAACEGGRHGTVSRRRVAKLRAALDSLAPAPAASWSD